MVALTGLMYHQTVMVMCGAKSQSWLMAMGPDMFRLLLVISRLADDTRRSPARKSKRPELETGCAWPHAFVGPFFVKIV